MEDSTQHIAKNLLKRRDYFIWPKLVTFLEKLNRHK